MNWFDRFTKKIRLNRTIREWYITTAHLWRPKRLFTLACSSCFGRSSISLFNSSCSHIDTSRAACSGTEQLSCPTVCPPSISISFSSIYDSGSGGYSCRSQTLNLGGCIWRSRFHSNTEGTALFFRRLLIVPSTKSSGLKCTPLCVSWFG